MPIPPLSLDDLTWADLTAAARQRIPAASRGRWTLHAPVDPGVTLIELHAWLLEQRLYWMDQVPDSLSRGALALLGEAAHDAVPATTVLYFAATKQQRLPAGTSMQLQDSDPPLVFTTQKPATLLPLAAADGNAAVQLPRIGIMVDAVERAGDLAAGRTVCVFRRDGDEIAVTLWMQAALAAAAGDALSLLVLLDTAGAEVSAEWTADAVAGIASPATLSWWYATATGRAAFVPQSISDGTGGLRRSGIVRLTLPTDWAAGQADGQGRVPYRLWLRADAAGFSAPPRLAGLWPNVAPAVHRRVFRSRRAVDWLKLPSQLIRLPADEQPVLSGGTAVGMLESDGQRHWWQPVVDMSFSGREDRVFAVDRTAGTLTFGNGETGRIPLPVPTFACRDLIDPAGLASAWKGQDPVSAFIVTLLSAGAAAQITGYDGKSAPSRPLLRALLEGLNAAIASDKLYDNTRFAGVRLSEATRALLLDYPPEQPVAPAVLQRRNRLLLQDAYPRLLGTGTVDLRLAIGGGTAGNAGAMRVWEPVGTAPMALNVVAADGGLEPEPLSNARQRAAQDLRRVDRAVLAADFEELARTTPGVAIRRAHAAIGVHPDFPCLAVPGVVSVFIVPGAPRNEEPAVCPPVPAPLPDAGALAAVSARLDAARLIGSEVFVRPPVYRPVALSVDVQTQTAAPDVLRTALTTSLTRFLDPLVGGTGEDGWPWGGPVRPSTLLVRAQEAIGGQGEVMRVGIALTDTGNAEQSCNDVDIGAHALPALRRVSVRLSPVPAGAAGGLT